MLKTLMLLIILAGLISTFAVSSGSSSTYGKNGLFSMDNLTAWCIIPYDTKNRSPLERARMLRELGFRKMAYDWRDQHLPHFPEEIRVLRDHGIELAAVWLWIDEIDGDGLQADQEFIFNALEDAGVGTSIWVGFHENVHAGLPDDQKVARVAGIVDRLQERARKSGSRVALYNHGGWVGIPENQVRIIRASRFNDIGIVFNFHHGHDQIDRFADALQVMKPWLETVNLNGMKKDGSHIVDIGKGNHERDMIQTLLDSGFSGNIGIIGHTTGEDVREVLSRNLHGLDQILSDLQGN
jgi:hypothetical protein